MFELLEKVTSALNSLLSFWRVVWRSLGSKNIGRIVHQLEKVTDFVYHGAWIATTERDLRVRKAKAWAACHKLKKM